jgi:hypothetical protein
VVHKATAKDIDERYATAADFAADLQRFLDGQSVMAPRYRYQLDEGEIAALRPAWMLPVAAAFAALALLIIVVALVGGITTVTTYGLPALNRWTLAGPWFFLTAIGVGVYVTSAGIVAGRIWAKWVGLAITTLMILGSLSFGGWLVATQWKALTREWQMWPYLLFPFAALAVGLGLTHQLLASKTREWFRFASSLRAEHRKRKRREKSKR